MTLSFICTTLRSQEAITFKIMIHVFIFIGNVIDRDPNPWNFWMPPSLTIWKEQKIRQWIVTREIRLNIGTVFRPPIDYDTSFIRGNVVIPFYPYTSNYINFKINIVYDMDTKCHINLK